MEYTSLLATMSLPEKVGQLFMLAFAGDRLDEARMLFEKHLVGGAYLSNDNLPSPAAASLLTAQLQEMAANTRLGLPLLLGADHEGTWSVMTPGSATGPGNLAIGATGDPQCAHSMYRVLGRELAASGVNTLLGPCADCNCDPRNPIIGMRSFGESPALVAEMTAVAVRGAHEGGVLATLKHFPGHGDTRVDSHRGLPTVERTGEELRRRELAPFVAGIAAGADIVMTSHILFPAYDAQRPATLSPAILQGLLRDDFSFEGLILSDSMNMQALRRHYDPAQALIHAINAGVDMVMLAEEHYAHDAATYLAQQRDLIGAVIRAVETGELPVARLDDAVGRVLRLKERISLERPPFAPQRHGLIEMDVARRAITLVRDRHGLIPLERGAPLILVNTTRHSAYDVLTRTRGIGPNQHVAAFDVLADTLRDRRDGLRVVEAEEALAGDLGTLPQHAVIVAVTENYTLPGMDFDTSGQAEVIARLHALAPERLIVAALRDPYELAGLPDVGTYVCSCSPRPCAARAMAAVLCGEAEARGRLPVNV